MAPGKGAHFLLYYLISMRELCYERLYGMKMEKSVLEGA